MTTTENLFTTPESRGPDRFFLGKVDGREKLFVLRWDHSISIASASETVTVEAAQTLLAELSGLAA